MLFLGTNLAINRMIQISGKLHADKVNAASFGFMLGGSSFGKTDNIILPYMASINKLTDQLLIDMQQTYSAAAKILEQMILEDIKSEAQSNNESQQGTQAGAEINGQNSDMETLITEAFEAEGLDVEVIEGVELGGKEFLLVVPESGSST